MNCFGCGKFTYLGRCKSFSYGIATKRNKTANTLSVFILMGTNFGGFGN